MNFHNSTNCHKTGIQQHFRGAQVSTVFPIFFLIEDMLGIGRNSNDKTKTFWQRVTEITEVYLSKRQQKSTLVCSCFQVSFNTYRQLPAARFSVT